jgi:hypothetical protein
MKKALNRFFVVLGVIFFIILLVIAGLFIFNSGSGETDTSASFQDTINVMTGSEVSGDGIDSNPALNESQKTALETFGIDPASLPTSISPEQEACFIELIGVGRVEEIKAGDTPTVTEIFRGRGCL